MRFIYEPYILRRLTENRVFLVNPAIPFEYFFDCFQYEHPFFMISPLEDGRVAIAPNAMTIPVALFQTGYWPKDMLPTGYEYVTFKNGSYPVIISAHPVRNFEEWLRTFEGWVKSFGKQTLTEFVASSHEYMSLEESETKYRTEAALPVTPR